MLSIRGMIFGDALMTVVMVVMVVDGKDDGSVGLRVGGYDVGLVMISTGARAGLDLLRTPGN